MCRLLELMIFNVYRAERRNELQYWPRRVDNELRAANVNFLQQTIENSGTKVLQCR